MTVNGLKFIADKLNAAGIPYCFEEWTKDIQYPYFVGSYTESEPLNEDGESNSTFLLTGTTRDSWLSLEQLKAEIKNIFPALPELTYDESLSMMIDIQYVGYIDLEKREAETLTTLDNF